MYTVFMIGNIASGKSTASRYLESLGARRIDLDAMAKDLYIPGSALVSDIADAFGWDVLDENGFIRSTVLAERAFGTPDQIKRLNDLVHPVLLMQLSSTLLPVNCCSALIPSFPLTVVEVSAAASFTDAFGLADEVMAITAPVEVRRLRAVERGMSEEDFDARATCQPTEEELCSLASFVIDNTAADDSLFRALDDWAASRGIDFGACHA